MDALDQAMEVLNGRRMPYYAAAAEFAADKASPAKRQVYRDAISDLDEASEEVLRAQADAVYEALFG